MSNLDYRMASLLKAVEQNPGILFWVLVCACAITLIIAIVTDARQPREQMAGGKRHSHPRSF